MPVEKEFEPKRPKNGWGVVWCSDKRRVEEEDHWQLFSEIASVVSKDQQKQRAATEESRF